MTIHIYVLYKQQKNTTFSGVYAMVEEGGFEPPKVVPTDLQSVPFGRSGTLPQWSW